MRFVRAPPIVSRYWLVVKRKTGAPAVAEARASARATFPWTPSLTVGLLTPGEAKRANGEETMKPDLLRVSRLNPTALAQAYTDKLGVAQSSPQRKDTDRC